MTTKKWLDAVCFLLACAVLLSSCVPTAQPVGPPAPAAGAKQRTPLATVTAQGVDLPGRLLFVQAGDLWVWSGASGAQITQRGDLAQPAWSPDGMRIACVRRGPSFSDIVLLPAGGGEPVALTDGDSEAPPNSFERARSTTWSFYPAFAPDGQSVFYASQAGPAVGNPAADFNLSLYQTAAVAGGQRTQRYAADEGQIGRVTVQPDGAAIFAFQPTATGQAQVLRYAEGEAMPIAGVPAGSYDPALSADGRWLAFAARANGATDIYAIPAAGGTPTKLTTVGSARAGVLSPDSKWLAFLALTPGSSSFDLWIAPLALDGGALSAGAARAVTTGMRIDPDSGLAWGK